jgi:hypothetical protein
MSPVIGLAALNFFMADVQVPHCRRAWGVTWLGWGRPSWLCGVPAVFALLLAFRLLGQASRLNAAAISARV